MTSHHRHHQQQQQQIPPPPVLVLYRISNDDDKDTGYNATYLPRDHSLRVTLRTVKKYLTCLSSQYHWRVRMEDKNSPSFSWWDVQDENANLPARAASMSEITKLYFNKSSANKSSSSSGSSNPSNTAKQALKGLTKALSNAAGEAMNNVSSSSQSSSDPFAAVPMRVLVLQMIDLGKLRRKYSVVPAANHQTPSPVHHPGAMNGHRVAAPAPAPVNNAVPEANLMDFGSSPIVPTTRKAPAPRATPQRTPQYARKNETRAEKLKREYKQNAQKQNRVWDDIDQRWVVAPTPNGKATISPSATPGTSHVRSNNNKNSVKGISIDATNAVGKSAKVQQAVHARVNDMKKAQNLALKELREREKRTKEAEDEEDIVRRRLEPKVKRWSEEHGKKKQLRALLASLQIILWPECNWKPVNIGDILDDKKARRCYLKATLKVHPDKTKDLDAEKRFIAKRVFDALSQAFTEFEGKK